MSRAECRMSNKKLTIRHSAFCTARAAPSTLKLMGFFHGVAAEFVAKCCYNFARKGIVLL